MANQVEQWAARLGNRPIPVLDRTMAALEHLCRDEQVPVARIAEVAEQDPGLTVQLLRMANGARRGRLSSEVGTVQQALMLLGTERVRALPRQLPAIGQVLEDKPRSQLMATFARAYHAARQADEWARRRRDMTPDEVYAASLLHFIGEMVLSLYAPEKLEEIYTLRNEEKVATAEAQYVVLGFTIDELSRHLARRWRLPQLVHDALLPENAHLPRAYGIMLAVELVRVGQYDWFCTKAREIERAAAKWLGEAEDAVIARAHTLAAQVARESAVYDAVPAAVRLLWPPLEAARPARAAGNGTAREPGAPAAPVGLCLMPQLPVLKAVYRQLAARAGSGMPLHEAVELAVQGMHDGAGLNRVVFARIDHERRMLVGEAARGADNEPIFNRFEVRLDQPHLFTRLLERQQALWLRDDNRAKIWPLVSPEIRRLLGTNSFFAMSVHVDGRPMGLFYADRHTSACELNEQAYKYFKALAGQAALAMSHRQAGGSQAGS